MVSVVIVNYNRSDLLKECVDSVRGQGFKDTEIIVVDNASADGSIGMLTAHHPGVRLISNKKNLLLCKAYNQGIDESKGDFILCLNNDVVLDRDYLREVMIAFGQDMRIGMTGGKILRGDKKTIDSTGLSPGRNRKAVERGYGEADTGQYEAAGYVFGITGACACYRKSMLFDIKDKNGYFDEAFGMYYEDLDLCWRAQRRGWRAYYNPRARAYHLRAASASINRDTPHSVSAGRGKRGRNFPYLPYELKMMYIKNRYRCIGKNDTLIGFLSNLLFIAWYDARMWVYMMTRYLLRIFVNP